MAVVAASRVRTRGCETLADDERSNEFVLALPDEEPELDPELELDPDWAARSPVSFALRGFDSLTSPVDVT
jgi:hypothetical protein